MSAPVASPAPAGAWPDGALRSPRDGGPLRADTPHSLTDAEARWPVVEGIPFLRGGREALAREALGHLDAGEPTRALVALLADRDGWAPGEPPSLAARERVAADGASLRERMSALGFGPVADYFACRPSDPSFLSCLGLLAAGWDGEGAIFELACGMGHLGREVRARGGTWCGADVVFAKLWLARRHVVGDAPLVCTDAEGPLPLGDASADVALCHDALYFMRDKRHVVGELERIAPTVLLGHLHTPHEKRSTGAPLDPAGWAALLPGAELHDDAALARSALTRVAARPAAPAELGEAPAVSLVRSATPPRAAIDLARPPAGTPLRAGPLYERRGDRLALRWPSDRHEAEYAPLAGHLPAEVTLDERGERDAIAGYDAEIDDLARRRVLVDRRWPG